MITIVCYSSLLVGNTYVNKCFKRATGMEHYNNCKSLGSGVLTA
jgi:hypothetical protein